MVRVIPVLLILAVAYWLAAPDPVTAGARTAAGTGVKAAGAGIRDHWSSGRDDRALTRTKRRDRWSKGGGFWRNLLRLEHGAVITGKGVKGAAGITRAAVKPVPAAVKAGWVSGRDRHRAKAGNRPVPVALDPPWWRREQPQVQPEEQVPEQPAEQVEPGPWVIDVDSLPDEGRRYWLTELGFDPDTPRGQDPAPIEVDPRREQSRVQAGNSPAEQVQDTSREQVTEIPGIGEVDPDAYTATTRRLPDGSVRGELFYAGAPEEGEQLLATIDRDSEDDIRREFADIVGETQRDNAWGTPARIAWVPLDEDGRPPSPYGDLEPERLDTEEQIRDRRTPTWNRLHPQPLTESDRRFWTARDGGYTGPLNQDGRPGDPGQWPFKTVAVPADTTTEQSATPTPTEGGPVPAPTPTELRNLTAVEDFAQQVDNLSETSDFIVVAEKARTVGQNSRSGGFGGEMDLATDSLEETARRFAQSVDDFRAKAHQLAKTSVSVRGA